MNYYCVFDFETDHKNPNIACPTQLACMMIDPFTLDIVEGSEFSSRIRPIDIDTKDYWSKQRISTLEFHCKNRSMTKDEIKNEWLDSPSTDVVWKQFVDHVNIYNKKNWQSTCPISAGMNIKNFDLIIANRLNEKYKIKRLFNYEIVDLRDLAFFWLQWDTNLKSRSMDSLRKYFGMSTENAHDALADVKQTAMLISKFLKLHKQFFSKILFKGALKN